MYTMQILLITWQFFSLGKYYETLAELKVSKVGVWKYGLIVYLEGNYLCSMHEQVTLDNLFFNGLKKSAKEPFLIENSKLC